MTIRKKIELIQLINKCSLLVTCMLSMSGCIIFAESPHEIFKGHLNVQVGENIDDVPPFQIPHKEDLIGSKILSNGNIENEYKFRGTCRYFYEINPKSRKIVSTRFEGKETDCIINP